MFFGFFVDFLLTISYDNKLKKNEIFKMEIFKNSNSNTKNCKLKFKKRWSKRNNLENEK